MLRSRVIALIGFCSLCFTGLANAAGPKVGFVDIPLLIDKAPQAISASTRLERQFQPRQDRLKREREAIEAMARKLKKNKLTMSETQLENQSRELREKERNFRRNEQEFLEDLSLEKGNEFKKVRELVLDVIASFAKKKGYDLIISDGVLYASNRIDITDDVLKALKKR